MNACVFCLQEDAQNALDSNTFCTCHILWHTSCWDVYARTTNPLKCVMCRTIIEWDTANSVVKAQIQEAAQAITDVVNRVENQQNVCITLLPIIVLVAAASAILILYYG